MARPVKYTRKRRREILAALLTYIEDTDIPIIAEFCYQNKLSRQRLYEFAEDGRWPREAEEFSDALELLRCKKEANLEIGGLTRALEPKIVALSLSQLGWSEKTTLQGPDGRDLMPSTIEVEFVDPQGSPPEPETGGES